MVPAAGFVKAPFPQSLAVVGAFVLVSVLWSWPLILDPTGSVVSGIDTWGTLWSLGGVHSLETAWPLGQNLGRADSLVLLALRRVVPVGSPTLAAAVWVLLAPVATALAAEACARGFGAKRPWSLIAGFTLGFGGPATAALVDGQLYTLFCPWLPLMALDWHRATRPEGTALQGLRTGVWWALCLATTAYLGIAATLWVVGGLLAAALRRDLRWRGPAAAAAGALPAGLLYLSAFASGDTRTGVLGVDPARAMEVGSASLATLASWAPVVAADPHAVASPLGFVPVVLVALAPLILGGQRGWRFPALVGGFALVASLGPTLRLAPGMAGAPGLLAPLTALSGAAWFRFPARLLWVTTLGFGLVASLAAGSLARRPGARPLVLVLLAATAVEVLAVVGAPFRTTPALATPPSALAALPDGPHLSLFAPSPGRHVDVELFLVDRSCAWQAWHRQPLFARCLDTDTRSDPRARVSAQVHAALLANQPTEARALLRSVGAASVSVRPDSYAGGEAEAVLSGLETALGPATAASSDAGVQILVFAVPDPVTDRAQARDALAALP